jgi:hypothetical protein
MLERMMREILKFNDSRLPESFFGIPLPVQARLSLHMSIHLSTYGHQYCKHKFIFTKLSIEIPVTIICRYYGGERKT